jgi:hypothetical protein
MIRMYRGFRMIRFLLDMDGLPVYLVLPNDVPGFHFRAPNTQIVGVEWGQDFRYPMLSLGGKDHDW